MGAVMSTGKILPRCPNYDNCTLTQELKRLRERNERLSSGLNGAIIDFRTIEKGQDIVTGEALTEKQIKHIAWRMRLYLQEVLG